MNVSCSFCIQRLNATLEIDSFDSDVSRFMTTDSKRMEMVDMVCQVQSDIEKSLPFHWVAFGVDVAELFANQKQFVEGTQEARKEVMFLSVFLN